MAGKAVEMDVLAILPGCFLELSCVTDLRAFGYKMMLEIGPRQIEDRVMQLAAMARDVLCRAGGAPPAGQQLSPIVTARFEGKDARTLARDLKARNVLVAARHGNLRVSPHFYNDETDLERFEKSLREIL